MAIFGPQKRKSHLRALRETAWLAESGWFSSDPQGRTLQTKSQYQDRGSPQGHTSIHDEEEAKRVEVAAELERRDALSKCKSAPTPCPITNLTNASSRSPTNRDNCRPQIHHRLQVCCQAYHTRPCRSIGVGTSSSSPWTYRTDLSRRQCSRSVLIDMALFVPRRRRVKLKCQNEGQSLDQRSSLLLDI